MIDVCLLGTGGMMPLPDRWLTALMLKYNGQSILIDCGEGTQIALREVGWSAKQIDLMCFTHYHADHISGLPGMLLTMGNAERTEPLLMVGPKGLERVVNSLRAIAPELPFEIRFKELPRDEDTFDFGDLEITAFKVLHKLTCYGYTVKLKRKGKFSVDRAKQQNIPLKFWNRLQHGETGEEGGVTYTPSMVLGEERKGLHITYCTDTRPVPQIAEQAKDADLFICEGMYGDKDCAEKAAGYKHMTMQEAARICEKARPKEVWLTHFSPSMMKPKQYMDEIDAIYPGIIIPKDGRIKELNFDEE